MNEEDIYKDILDKYPEEKILAFCVNAITKKYSNAITALGKGSTEFAAGALGEFNFYLGLLTALRDKKSDTTKETVVVA